MSTATKTRRVVPITPKGMATPKRKNKGAQAAVLANFDLEGESMWFLNPSLFETRILTIS